MLNGLNLPMITEYRKWHIFILTYWLRPLCVPGVLYMCLIGRIKLRGYVMPQVKSASDLFIQLPFRIISMTVFAAFILLIGSIKT